MELFYHDTEKIKPNNVDQEKDLEKRKVVVNTACKFYDNLSEDQKKTINVLKRLENLTLNFMKEDLPPMPPLEDDEEVKLKLQETISKSVKLNPQKRKK